MEARGVTVKLGTKVTGATRTSDGGVEVELTNGERLSGSELLVAAGRKGGIDFGLETVGLKPAGKHVPVDDSLCVKTADGGEWLYAPGDLNGSAAFTHSAKYHG